MTGLEIFLLVLIIAIVIAIPITIAIISYISKRSIYDFKLRMNSNVVLNLMPNHTDGYALGLEMPHVKKGKGNREIVSFVPIDLDDEFQEEEIRQQTIVVDKNKRVVIGKNTLSKNRDLIILMPKNISDIPQSLALSETGKLLQNTILEQNIGNATVKYLEDGCDRLQEIMRERPMGEATRQELDYVRGMAKEMLTIISGTALPSAKIQMRKDTEPTKVTPK